MPRAAGGLGLSICHEIATAMGGKVGVTSEPGVGSSFYFELDVGYQASAQDSIGHLPCAAPCQVSKRPLNILVAEDNEMSRALMQDLLTELGHHVTTAPDGERAVDAVRQNRFDLVFMDVMMPRMDGIRATRKIREAGPAGELPIIGCSAHVKDHKSYLSAGMDAFLPKPFERARLEVLLARYASRQRRSSPSLSGR
ncbi:MAG: response regulator [Rhodobacteraceae bacterium]|nr:response regulator [Paracoccaceae bacterium]